MVKCYHAFVVVAAFSYHEIDRRDEVVLHDVSFIRSCDPRVGAAAEEGEEEDQNVEMTAGRNKGDREPQMARL